MSAGPGSSERDNQRPSCHVFLTGNPPLAGRKPDRRDPDALAGTPGRGRHTRSPDKNPVDDGSRPPATWDRPKESDMSLMDVGAIAGAVVFLALFGLFFWKRCLK